MTEEETRDKRAVHGKSPVERRCTGGGPGNPSARLADGMFGSSGGPDSLHHRDLARAWRNGK
jgi:hypothetical protein